MDDDGAHLIQVAPDVGTAKMDAAQTLRGPAITAVDITDAITGTLNRLVALAQQQVQTGPLQWRHRYPGVRAVRALLGEENCCPTCGQPRPVDGDSAQKYEAMTTTWS